MHRPKKAHVRTRQRDLADRRDDATQRFTVVLAPVNGHEHTILLADRPRVHARRRVEQRVDDRVADPKDTGRADALGEQLPLRALRRREVKGRQQ